MAMRRLVAWYISGAADMKLASLPLANWPVVREWGGPSMTHPGSLVRDSGSSVANGTWRAVQGGGVGSMAGVLNLRFSLGWFGLWYQSRGCEGVWSEGLWGFVCIRGIRAIGLLNYGEGNKIPHFGLSLRKGS